MRYKQVSIILVRSKIIRLNTWQMKVVDVTNPFINSSIQVNESVE